VPADGRSEKLLLLDSASLYFRAFFGVPDSFQAPDGTPVNAVRGFLDMIATLLTMRRPDRLVACWDDDWRPAFRVAALPSYKTHRLTAGSQVVEESPPGLTPQVPIIVDLLAALGIARVGCAGFEGGRRHGHAGRARGSGPHRAGRGRDRRPRPVPARGRRAGGDGAVRRPG